MKQTDERTSKHHTSLGILSKIALFALLANATAYLFYLYLVTRVAGFIVPILVISFITLLVACLIATGRRWVPLLGALLALGSSAIDLAQPESIYNLTHPGEFGFFSVGVFILASAVVAFGAGITATVQNYRGTSKRVPAWFGTGLSVLFGLVLGMFLLSLIAFPVSQVPQYASPGSAVHMGPGQFLQSAVSIPKGGVLTLIDDGPFEHVLDNGSWSSDGTVHAAAETGAIFIHNKIISTGEVKIGPFNTAGVFHFYCTIHRGMNLTVFVS